MTHGRYQHRVLANAYGRRHLIEQGKKNNIPWEESSHDGVNWMRFSGATINHINQGRDFHMEDSDPTLLRNMIVHLTKMKEMHKQTMVPHVRAALHKLHENGGDPNKNPMDYLPEAYAHLEANGGHHWAEKIHTLNSLNAHISRMTKKVKDLGYVR